MAAGARVVAHGSICCALPYGRCRRPRRRCRCTARRRGRPASGRRCGWPEAVRDGSSERSLRGRRASGRRSAGSRQALLDAQRAVGARCRRSQNRRSSRSRARTRATAGPARCPRSSRPGAEVEERRRLQDAVADHADLAAAARRRTRASVAGRRGHVRSARRRSPICSELAPPRVAGAAPRARRGGRRTSSRAHAARPTADARARYAVPPWWRAAGRCSAWTRGDRPRRRGPRGRRRAREPAAKISFATAWLLLARRSSTTARSGTGRRTGPSPSGTAGASSCARARSRGSRPARRARRTAARGGRCRAWPRRQRAGPRPAGLGVHRHAAPRSRIVSAVMNDSSSRVAAADREDAAMGVDRLQRRLEQLGLGHEPHLAAQRGAEEEVVQEREVVRREEDGPFCGTFSAEIDPRAEERPGRRAS